MRDDEQYGTYYQAVRFFHRGGKVKQVVVRLGEHSRKCSCVMALTDTGVGAYRQTEASGKLQDKLSTGCGS